MKKKMNLSILIATAAMALGFSSCKKEWTCECKDGTNTYTYSLAYLGKVKKADAQKECDKGNGDGFTCKVK
ncbi:MAG: hypothetical protein U0U67_16665 [Chitinophagales bacterium]